MRTAVKTWALALLLFLPLAAGAKGGAMQPRPNKDFRELIVKGERPEIAACLVAAIDYARRDPGFGAIRWDEDASDRAVVRESESNGRLTRYIHFTAQLRKPPSLLHSEDWQTMQVSCEQPEDGSVQVSVKPASG